MNKSTLQSLSKLSILILCIIGLAELGLALWTVLDNRYRSLAYNLADVGYIDLWILRYLSLCLFASSIITLVMCLILIWGLYSTHVFLFIASTMLVVVLIGEFTISMITFANRYETRVTLIEQLPKLVITYRQGTDERAKRALDILQLNFQCCGSDGRLSYQNNVPLSCNMFYIGCLTRTMFYLDTCLDSLAVLLLIFSLIKLLIILFFYSFLCWYQKHRKSTGHFPDDSSNSDSSSSMDNLPRKIVTLPMEKNENEYTESNISRKLSLISERDDSELDLGYSRPYLSRPREYITTIVRRNDPPIVPSRRRIIRNENDDVDSGVERSSSEKSFDGRHHRSSTPLSFSKVFVTSVSQIQPTDSEVKEPLIISTPKSILKKANSHSPSTPLDSQRNPWSYTRTPPLIHRLPKPNPRRHPTQNQ